VKNKSAIQEAVDIHVDVVEEALSTGFGLWG